MINAVKNSRFGLFIERQIDAVKGSGIVLFLERHFLPIEFWTVVTATGVLVVWGSKFGGNSLIGELLEGDRSMIYGTLASIFGSLFGFTFAAMSFVVGLSNRERLHHLRTSPHFKTLRRAFMSAISWSGLSTIVAVCGLIADRGDTPVFSLVYIVFFTTILVGFRVANCVLLLGLIIDVVMQPSKVQSGGK